MVSPSSPSTRTTARSKIILTPRSPIPRAKPTTGGITIKDNLWAYDDSSFESNGKKTVIRVTNEFTNPKTEAFKVVSSEDDGTTWKTMLQGVARKVGG